ncbi:hypothetical protein PDESU_02648 [Pontiella desulfatans]|uniref:Uncharacterized protein n=1 Tax=Pontiella desulfatans TaxID=2750659 RepID=A0A6C2U3F0_PONDE|nr:hypothetical protein [Pontiella desulfatans]VGO14091.1 hypothetical protein PDESU_02648 [Pontiella desulfatans]
MKAIVMKSGGRADGDFGRMRSLLACVGKDKMRPELHYILVEKTKGGVYAVGCDGLRLRRDLFRIKAEPGLYEIKVNNSREIRLVPSPVKVRYQEYRKIIPSHESESTYSTVGKSSRFAMWVGAALGCYVDPKLVPIAHDEYGEIHVQKTDGGIMPLVFQNDHTLVVVMPMKLDGHVGEQLDRMQLDRLRRQRKMKVTKSSNKKEPTSWWTTLVRRKAA